MIIVILILHGSLIINAQIIFFLPFFVNVHFFILPVTFKITVSSHRFIHYMTLERSSVDLLDIVMVPCTSISVGTRFIFLVLVASLNVLNILSDSI